MPEEITAGETPNEQETPTVTVTDAPEGETAEQKAERLAKELAGAQARIGELNKENEKRRLAEKKAAEDKLAEDGKLQELADERAKERDTAIAERDTISAKFGTLNEMLSKDLEKRVEKWPEKIKAKFPKGEGVDALQQMQFISEWEDVANELISTPARPGNGAGPNPAGGPSPANQKEVQEAESRRVLNVF